MVERKISQIELYIWCWSAASLRRKAASLKSFMELSFHRRLETQNAFTQPASQMLWWLSDHVFLYYLFISLKPRNSPPVSPVSVNFGVAQEYGISFPRRKVLDWGLMLCSSIVTLPAMLRWWTGVFQDPVTSQRGVVTAWTSHTSCLLGVVSGETFHRRGQQRPAFYPGVRLLFNNLSYFMTVLSLEVLNGLIVVCWGL